MSGQLITVVRAELPGGERAVAWREDSNLIVVLDSRLTAMEQKAAMKAAVRRQRRSGLAAIIPVGALIWWLRMTPSHRPAAIAGGAVGLAALATAVTLPFIGGEHHRPPPTAAPPSRPSPTRSAPAQSMAPMPSPSPSTPPETPSPTPPAAPSSPPPTAATPSASLTATPPMSTQPTTPPAAGPAPSLCVIDLDHPLRLPATARICLEGNPHLT